MNQNQKKRWLFIGLLAAGLLVGVILLIYRIRHRPLGFLTYDVIDTIFSLYTLFIGMAFEKLRSKYLTYREKTLSDKLHERRYGNRWDRQSLMAQLKSNYPSTPDLKRIDIHTNNQIIETAFYSMGSPHHIKYKNYDTEASSRYQIHHNRYGLNYFKILRQSGKEYKNELNFRLLEAAISGDELAITFGPTYFFDYLKSTGALDVELYDAITNHSPRKTPIRNMYMPTTAAMREARSRICLGGVNVVLAMKVKDKFNVILQVRSGEVADSRGEIAVIPKGFHQPLMEEFPYQSMDFRNSIYRELAEECFGHDLKQNETYIDAYEYFKNCKGVSEVIEGLETQDPNYSLHLTRFGFNSITGNYALNALLVIQAPHYYIENIQNIRKNFETKSFIQCDVTDSSILAHYLNDKRWNDDSIVAFCDALEVLRDRYKVPITPAIEVVSGQGGHEA